MAFETSCGEMSVLNDTHFFWNHTGPISAVYSSVFHIVNEIKQGRHLESSTDPASVFLTIATLLNQ